MKDKKELHVYVTECCKSTYSEIPETIIKTAPGVTSYFRSKCDKCGKPCHTRESQIFDTDGIEIKPEDMIETIEHGHNGETRSTWHACYLDDGWLTIRDLNANNVYMYNLGDYYNRGHYSNHMDKLDEDDLDYYFDIDKKDGTSSYRWKY